MQALLIDHTTIEKLRKLKEFAEAHPFSFDDLLDIKNGAAPPAGDRDGFSCVIPIGIRVVFSIENQPEVCCRHFSVSINREGKLPNPSIVEEIIKYLGFKSPLYDCHLSMEGQAINVIEEIKDKAE